MPNTSSMITDQIIATSIGALELKDETSGINDSALEQSALTLSAPSAHPPYCDLRTAMVTTCVDDSVLEASGMIEEAQPRSSNPGLLCF